MVHNILKNENYVGNLTYNRTSRRLAQTQINNPEHVWVRSSGVVDSVVDQDLFARAQKIMSERYISIPNDQILRRLRIALARKGKLTSSIIKNTPGLPSPSCLVQRFGSIRNAYKLIDYNGSRDCRWFEQRDHWANVLAELASQVAGALKADFRTRLNLTDDGTALTRGGSDKVISFQVVRKLAKRSPKHVALWRAHQRKQRAEFCVYLRLNDSNEAIQDYILLKSAETATPYLTLSDGLLARHNAVRIDAVSNLIRVIKARMISFGHAASAKRNRRNRQRKSTQSKSKNDRALRRLKK